MDRKPLLARVRRTLISLFLVVNFATVLYMSLPSEGAQTLFAWFSAAGHDDTEHHLRVADWRIRQYAYLTGLDNRWQMFGRQSRFNWWYVIRGIYGDSDYQQGDHQKAVMLELPNQSPRTLWQRCVTDLKEQKFRLNIYSNEVAREAYSRYLARQFSVREGKPIRAVRWELGYQMIMPPDVAMTQQKLVYPGCSIMPLNEFPVSPMTTPLASAAR
jgi:hypothetical protein